MLSKLASSTKLKNFATSEQFSSEHLLHSKAVRAETPQIKSRNDLYQIMRGKSEYKPQKGFTTRTASTSKTLY